MARIGIDLRATEEGFKAHFGRGTGRYVSELAKRLVASHGKELEIVPLGSAELCRSTSLRALFSKLPFGRQTLETHLFVPEILKHLGIDLMHFFSHGDAPARGSFPYVITVLDLIPLKFRALYRAGSARWRYDLARALERRSIKNATGILAISEATKRDLVTIMEVHPDSVFVTPLAVSKDFAPLRDQEKIESIRRKVLREHERYLLSYVGGIDHRKNIGFLLRLFKQIKDSLAPDGVRLALLGRYDREREYPALIRDIRELGLEENVELVGFAPDEDLPDYYKASDLSLFPSLYEGFGFPPLEAMACATPVLAGKNSSMPELFGTDLELLPDNDIPAWTALAVKLLTDESARLRRVELGLKRSALFSWDRTAQMTLQAYQYFLTGGESKERRWLAR